MSDELTLIKLARRFPDSEAARAYLEAKRWPNGAACPKCGGADPYKLNPKPGSKTRKGLWKCRACRQQFTVTVGTIFEDSHIALDKWLIAIHLMCSSKKGMSAHQLHRMLELSYKSAWFMCHRIRYAMAQPEVAEQLTGIVEADETYMGGKRKNMHWVKRQRFTGRGSVGKAPIVILVQRGGKVITKHMPKVTGETLKAHLKQHVSPEAKLMTDEHAGYVEAGASYASHEAVAHSTGEYVRGDVHINGAENYFSILKRGIVGVYHHVCDQHLHRYCSEFDFRYNRRDISDGERTDQAIKATEGKRLMYRGPVAKGE